METAVLVLAGGRSSRMGEPKHRVALPDGRSMIEHVLDAVRPLGLPIRISCATEPDSFLRQLCVPLLPDREPHQGPLHALALCLEESSAKRQLVVSCDQVRLTTRLLARLLEQPDERPAFFELPGIERLHPFPGLFPRSLLAQVMRAVASSERSPRRFLASVECRWVPIDQTGAAQCRSYNTPNDLQRDGLAPVTS